MSANQTQSSASDGNTTSRETEEHALPTALPHLSEPDALSNPSPLASCEWDDPAYEYMGDPAWGIDPQLTQIRLDLNTGIFTDYEM